MNNSPLDPELQTWLQADQPAESIGFDSYPAESFNIRVDQQTRRLKRRRVVARILAGVFLALMSIPLQDLALATTELLMLRLFPIDNNLLGQLLAPVNTVAGMLSAAVLMLRLLHKRIFS